MQAYDHKSVEQKWRKRWEESGLYKTPALPVDKNKKTYVLDMFPYPSGTGLHVGHPKGYIASDIVARFERMQGKSVLHPMGWDAFGLPAENYAIKNKLHPAQAVAENIQRFKKQLSLLGMSYDWSREITTTDPQYYKWTQWIFLQMFKKGLAYQSNEPINWCPSCKTGLANEDLENGKCERCGSDIERKPLRQWILRITDYAERLLDDLDGLDWPVSVKDAQRHWIGKSEGMLFSAKVKDTDIRLETFSAHFEAFYADTFVVIAPDHPLLAHLLVGVSNAQAILEEAGRIAGKQKGHDNNFHDEIEGVFTGRYLEDPVSKNDLPIWVASYALAQYGTGIVKCSAHDERDFAFAKKYNIPLHPVLFSGNKEVDKKIADANLCFSDMQSGILKEPKEFFGQKAGDARKEIANYLENHEFAKRTQTYRLRDWVFSRQRYWGEPIPLIHCKRCGVVPVPEKDLPVTLPEVDAYEPTGTGESPLAGLEDWVRTTCPTCGGEGRRETNTMPQWAGSCWYYLRYLDPHNQTALVDTKIEKAWMPVDVYVGGIEHATRHLIYVRFWHKFLFDNGVVSTNEPFVKLFNQGLIQGSDGRKMSKRFGNVINPDDMVDTVGADTLRVYEMFMGPFADSISWSTDNVAGARRFLEKVWRLAERVDETVEEQKQVQKLLHQTIGKVHDDIANFRFNTAISSLMILTNTLLAQKNISRKSFETLLKLLAPFAPHITEELWEYLGGTVSVHLSMWPSVDRLQMTTEDACIAVQVNGKVRGTLTVSTALAQEEMKNLAKNIPGVARFLEGETIQKIVIVPQRIINFVTRHVV